MNAIIIMIMIIIIIVVVVIQTPCQAEACVYRDRAVIRESSSLGLRLKNIDESFGGLYTCIGIVNGQREEDNIRLQVYRKCHTFILTCSP